MAAQEHDQGITGCPTALLCFPPLSRSARMRCHPQPLCCGHQAGSTSPCRVTLELPAPGEPSLPRGTVLGQAIEQKRGTHAVPKQGGSERRRKSSTEPAAWFHTLRSALFHVGMKTAPSPKSPPVVLESPTSNLLLPQPCLVRTASQLVTT